MPCKKKCSPQHFSVVMAVAGVLSFSIIADFDDDSVIIGYEHSEDVEIIARALGIHEFKSLNICQPAHGGVQEWRVLSWFTSCTAALKTFTICACSKSGSDVKMGWVGAITVGQDAPQSLPVAPAEVNFVSAHACASRRVISFASASGDEVCDIQCLWTPPSSPFFPFVDVYLESVPLPNDPENDLRFGQTNAESLVWQGRSASGVFFIAEACLSSPQQICLMGTNSLLQRVLLARIDIRVPWAESQGGHRGEGCV